GQRATLDRRMREYAAGRAEPTPLPAPGVYARSNAADLPALSGTGEPIEGSVPRVLRIRGQQRSLGEVSPETVAALVETREGTGPGVHGPEASRSVGQSGQPQMPGEAPPPTPPSVSTDVRTQQEGDR
ncbi:NADH-quinone oxidoreductase subunit J, partial [Georgenia sp. 10Sc9-8]|nr:NADH-quinone oxidoreductase subunit J [Georgenia halotolerans]